MQLRLTFFFLFIGFNLSSYSQKYETRLESNSDYISLAGNPLTKKYGGTKAVKVVYDLHKECLFYINTSVFTTHYAFCSRKLSYQNGPGNFLKENYSVNDRRRFLLANINYFSTIDKFVVDLSPFDEMSLDQVNFLLKEIQESSFFKGNLSFLLNNSNLLESSSEATNMLTIPCVDPQDIYRNMEYQAISRCKTKGILRMVNEGEISNLKFAKNDILVLKNIPKSIPIVAGIIVDDFQTPLSHLSILGINRKIPICAYTPAFVSSKLLPLDGTQVYFEVKDDTFIIRSDSTRMKSKSQSRVRLAANFRIDTLIGVDFLTKSSCRIVGHKAANFGVLNQISKRANFKVPEGAFAIPFYFYERHMLKSGASFYIDSLLNNNADDLAVDRYLKAIRNCILNEPVDSVLINAVRHRLLDTPEFTRFRFRSSTNAEDCKGFSGAGLYESKTAVVGDVKKNCPRAIKKVWASAWKKKAYQERFYYGIDQHKVAMGILVHRSFPDEKVNGVAITKNIYRKNSPAFFVNAQLGDENVVSHDGSITCDQFLCVPPSANQFTKDKQVLDIVTTSSLSPNALIMTNTQIMELAEELKLVKDAMVDDDITPWEYCKIGYDIEFKIDGVDDQLYFKQIRIYND